MLNTEVHKHTKEKVTLEHIETSVMLEKGTCAYYYIMNGTGHSKHGLLKKA